MKIYTITQWLMFFYIYCFLGWVWESIYVSVCKKKLVNRGFLKGPFLPIYGSGALCILIATIPVRGNVPLMCLMGMASATVLEYVTGAVMERLFRVRYWDYTGKFLNVNGHICLSSTLCWGVMTVLVVDVFHVHIEQIVLSVNPKWIEWAVFIITPCITADFVTSFSAAIKLRDVLIQSERIKEELLKLSEKISEKKAELEGNLSGTGGKAKEQIMQEMQELLLKAGELKGRLRSASSNSIKGLLKRNPTAISHIHRESFAELKQSLVEKIEEIRK